MLSPAAASVPSRSWRLVARRQRTGRTSTWSSQTGANELNTRRTLHQSSRNNVGVETGALRRAHGPTAALKSSGEGFLSFFERSLNVAGPSRHFASAVAQSIEEVSAASEAAPLPSAAPPPSESSSRRTRQSEARTVASQEATPRASSSKTQTPFQATKVDRKRGGRVAAPKSFQAQVQEMQPLEVRRQLGVLLSTPERSRASSHSSRVWYLYRRLAMAEDANDPQLTGDPDVLDSKGRPATTFRMDRPMLSRVLRQCVPAPVVVRKTLAVRIARSTEQLASIQAVTAYDWEPRLKDVIGRIKAVVAREAETVGEAAEGSSSGASASSHWASPEDYEFVMQQFAYSGHLVGSEELWRQLRTTDVLMTRGACALRIATFAKWLSVRVAIRKRFEVTNAPERRRHAFGDSIRIADAKARPFFPPEVAALFHDILAEVPKPTDPLPFRKLAYDHLLRAAKEAGLEGATTTILRLAYGVDLSWPDVPVAQIEPALLRKRSSNSAINDEEWARLIPESAASSPTAMAPISVHSINTVLHMLVSRGDIWQAVQTLDVLSRPRGSAGWTLGRPRRIANDLDTIGRFTQNPRPASNADDDEPLTLSEAIKREEQSGQRLGVFGGRRWLAAEEDQQVETPEPASEETPSFPTPTGFDDFLSPVPTPAEVAAEARSRDYTFVLPACAPNATSFAMLIEGAARWGASSSKGSRVDLNLELLELAVQLVHHAAREQAEQRNSYIRAQLNIRAAKPNVDDVEAWKQDRLRSLDTPTVTVDAEMLRPMFSAIYMSASRAPGRRLVAELLEVVGKVLLTSREELQVLRGEGASAADESDLTLNARRHLHLLERQIEGLDVLVTKEQSRAEADTLRMERLRHRRAAARAEARVA